MPSRRDVVAGLSVIGTVSLSGCTGVLSETSVNCGMNQAVNGGVCEVEATNNGFPGDKRIILETRDSNGNILGTKSETVNMDFGETARVNINPSLHSEMDDLTVSIESA